jgi:hypothetical protein
MLKKTQGILQLAPHKTKKQLTTSFIGMIKYCGDICGFDDLTSCRTVD